MSIKNPLTKELLKDLIILEEKLLNESLNQKEIEQLTDIYSV